MRDRDLHIHQAAVAQYDDKEAEAATRVTYGDRAEGAPIDLSTLAGSKGEFQERGLARGADGAYVRFDDGIAAIKALLTQALEDLRGRIGIALQQADNLRFKGMVVSLSPALRREA